MSSYISNTWQNLKYVQNLIVDRAGKLKQNIDDFKKSTEKKVSPVLDKISDLDDRCIIPFLAGIDTSLTRDVAELSSNDDGRKKLSGIFSHIPKKIRGNMFYVIAEKNAIPLAVVGAGSAYMTFKYLVDYFNK